MVNHIKSVRGSVHSDTSRVIQRRIGKYIRVPPARAEIERPHGIVRFAADVEEIRRGLEENSDRTVDGDIEEGVTAGVIASHLVGVLTRYVQIPCAERVNRLAL